VRGDIYYNTLIYNIAARVYGKNLDLSYFEPYLCYFISWDTIKRVARGVYLVDIGNKSGVWRA